MQKYKCTVGSLDTFCNMVKPLCTLEDQRRGDFCDYPLREKKEMRKNELMSEWDQMKYLILIFTRRITDCCFLLLH